MWKLLVSTGHQLSMAKIEFDGDKDQFKKLAYGLLYVATLEPYKNSLQLFEEFPVNATTKD